MKWSHGREEGKTTGRMVFEHVAEISCPRSCPSGGSAARLVLMIQCIFPRVLRATLS
jgi:hypothetical protein